MSVTAYSVYLHPPPCLEAMFFTSNLRTCCAMSWWQRHGCEQLCHSGLSLFIMVGQNSVVSVATRYALDSLGSESQWRWDYPHPSSLALKPTQLPEQWVPDLFPWSKMDRVWCWPLTPYSVEVKERVELYLYSPSGSSCSVVGWTLLFRLLCLMYDNVTNVKC